MVWLAWNEVSFAGVVVAGLVAGYVMAIAGLWAGQVPGLVAIDISDYGRRYMVSDRPSAWLLGFASHLANSVLLVLLWACTIEPNLDWPRPLEGLLWGGFQIVGPGRSEAHGPAFQCTSRGRTAGPRSRAEPPVRTAAH